MIQYAFCLVSVECVINVSDWRIAAAIRYTQSNAGDGLVSFMAFISITGLVLGVAVLVLVLSVMNGFERELRERVLGVLPHGIVASVNGFDDWHLLAEKIQTHPEISAAAPFLEGGALVVANGTIAGVSYFGVDPDFEEKVSIINNYFTVGSLDSLEEGSFNLLMGTTLAQKLGVSVGAKVTLVLPDVQLSMAGAIPRTKRFTLVGLFEVGADVDKAQVLVHLEDGLRLGRKTKVPAIRIATSDLFNAPRILREVQASLSDGSIYTTSWMRRHGNLYDAIQMQKSTMFLLLLMLVAVAGFNVVSNLMMVVNEKKSDIAILRTMGASTREILLIFIVHGLLLGSVGVLLGLILGVLSASYITEIYMLFDRLFGFGLMDEYFIHYLPSEIMGEDLVVVSLVSVFICFLVTIYPARVAARANPIEALKYE